jgi:hypothetical protein
MIITEPQMVSEVFKSWVFLIRKQKVILDEGIAQLQGMKTSCFNRDMKSHQHLFRSDDRFWLTPEEFTTVRLHSERSNGQGGRRYLPNVDTERGVEIVLSVLKREHSAQVGVAINRILSNLHEILKSTTQLERKCDELAKTNILTFPFIERFAAADALSRAAELSR